MALNLVLACVAASAACRELSPTAPSAAPVNDAAKPQGAPRVARGAFWSGAYLGDAETTPELVGPAIAAFAGMSGRRPSLIKSFQRLDVDLSASGWAGRVLRAVDAAGATNYVALDLDWKSRAPGGLLAAIVRGDADTMIDRTARGVAGVGSIVLIEAGWEMNGASDYPWQGQANGGDSRAPALYVAAVRRIVDRFRAAGAMNARWVFNPNTGNPLASPGAGAASWNWYANYYPGDAYVDFIGAHGYNGPSAFRSPYHSFVDLFSGVDADRMLQDMKQRYPSKPIILGEIGAEETAGRDKGAWVQDAYERMVADPQIVGAVWFNMHKEADWRVNSSGSALAGYRVAMQASAIADRYSEAGLLLASGR